MLTHLPNNHTHHHTTHTSHLQAEKVFNSIRGRHQIKHKKSEQTSEDPDQDNDPSETTSSSLNETSTTPTASKPRIESIETE